MDSQIIERAKLNHPFYKIMELKGDQLFAKINSWSRLEIIDWLCWNDRNGIYRDEDSLEEFGEILTKEHAIEIMIRQINEV